MYVKAGKRLRKIYKKYQVLLAPGIFMLLDVPLNIHP